MKRNKKMGLLVLLVIWAKIVMAQNEEAYVKPVAPKWVAEIPIGNLYRNLVIKVLSRPVPEI